MARFVRLWARAGCGHETSRHRIWFPISSGLLTLWREEIRPALTCFPPWFVHHEWPKTGERLLESSARAGPSPILIANDLGISGDSRPPRPETRTRRILPQRAIADNRPTPVLRCKPFAGAFLTTGRFCRRRLTIHILVVSVDQRHDFYQGRHDNSVVSS